MHWFDNPSITHSLPPLYRAYAAYSRLMADRPRSIVRGGSALLSVVIALTRATSWVSGWHRSHVAPEGIGGSFVPSAMLGM